MYPSILMLGGPKDGERYPTLISQPNEIYCFDENRKKHIYYLTHVFGNNGQSFPVYCHLGDTMDPIAMLLEGYRNET